MSVVDDAAEHQYFVDVSRKSIPNNSLKEWKCARRDE
jgi:hypothetical protein